MAGIESPSDGYNKEHPNPFQSQNKQYTASVDSLPAKLPRPQRVGYLLTTLTGEIALY